MNKTELIDKLLHLGSTIEICNSSKTSKKAKKLANTLLDNYLESINYTDSCKSDVSQQRELLIDFMNKTQGKLIWGWDIGGGEKLADEYLKGNL